MIVEQIIKSFFTPYLGSEPIIITEKEIEIIKDRIKSESNIKEITKEHIYDLIDKYLEKNSYFCYFDYKDIKKYLKRKV